MTANHARFQKSLIKSHNAVVLVAEWFKANGYEVNIEPLRVSPTFEERQEYSDQGDLYVKMDGQWERIEVKNPKCDFTHLGNFPFRNRLFICQTRAWDRAEPKPHRFYIVNRARTHAAVVDPIATRAQWWEEEVTDTRYCEDDGSPGRVQTVYCMKANLVMKWQDFNEPPE